MRQRRLLRRLRKRKLTKNRYVLEWEGGRGGGEVGRRGEEEEEVSFCSTKTPTRRYKRRSEMVDLC